jgi:hypothetical protein
MTWSYPTDSTPETLCVCGHSKSLHTDRPEGHPGPWCACSAGAEADDPEKLCRCVIFMPDRDPEA